jgi:hypothetical protein
MRGWTSGRTLGADGRQSEAGLSMPWRMTSSGGMLRRLAVERVTEGDALGGE